MAVIEGKIRGNSAFNLLVPTRWEFADFGNNAIQVCNIMGSFMVSLKKNGLNTTEQDEAALIALMSEKYNGTQVERVEFKGINWFKIVFDASGFHQSLFTAIKDGRKISIQLAGPDHESNEIIQAIFNSIEIL
ncbi:MAG: hypothetical protein CVU11_13880 [Bacteroidetes bacterium HGW-Bacteroidetes-6]|jgi:hypothetical protein|nr:MAG: hypothetical protein CVU11_13880 [Bacteroidetes bacterium HGW-Bacteroidetes-6]